MAEPLRLAELAAQVADGSDVDWDGIERSATSAEERRVVANLRLVAKVVHVHTSQPVPELSEAEAERMTASLDAPPATPPLVPERWGKLHILEKLDEGAFGEVYRGWDPDLECEAALKLLKADGSGGGAPASTMLHEGRLLARVRHPNVVTVYGVEEHAGRIGLRMELVRGRSLSELLVEHGTFGAQEAAVIGVDLCRALAAVHGVGLVHRDVKSRNVMRAEGGRIVLMDFGAVRDVTGGAPRPDVVGTPPYIAPEVFLGAPPSARSDIYSLGVVLYHLVTDAYPVQGGSIDELRAAHRRRETRLLRDARPDLPQAFVSAVERALAWDPAERFATAGQMEQALTSALGAERRDNSRAPAAVVSNAALPIERRRFINHAALWLLPLILLPAAYFAWRWAAASRGSSAIGGYTVGAALYRTGEDGQRERLESGARLAVGDYLSLEFLASDDLYLYVIAEDEQGRAFALFPIPALDVQNPLAAGVTHSLPGSRGGEPVEWRVDTAGGREHLLLLASPEQLADYEFEMGRLPRPDQGALAQPIPEQAKAPLLRGIGALGTPPTPGADASANRLFEMAERLAGGAEKVTGVWLRTIELENPSAAAGAP